MRCGYESEVRSCFSRGFEGKCLTADTNPIWIGLYEGWPTSLTELPSSPVMDRLVIRTGLALALALSGLGLCVFTDCTPHKNTHNLASPLAGIAAVLGDPGTQATTGPGGEVF